MRVAVEDLSFAYRRGGERIVDNLTYVFPAGAVTAITGPSGCGKSTLLYILALMLRARSGRVVYDGRDVSRLRDGERSRLRGATIGFVFQDAMLDLSRSVAGNVGEGALYAGMKRDRQVPAAAALLQRFEVGHRADHRPGEVSGGQAQRIALCRALVKRPALVLGDEPTGNLDARSTEVVWSALTETAGAGATVVVATHDVALAARADQTLELGS